MTYHITYMTTVGEEKVYIANSLERVTNFMNGLLMSDGFGMIIKIERKRG